MLIFDIQLFGLILFAYLLGSFSSAITLSKVMGFPDPRSQGSGNPGATNVKRIAGSRAAAITLVLDLLKGVIPVVIAHFILPHPVQIALVGFAAFIGHCYPVFYQFKGGKGVATALGFTLAYQWMIGLIIALIWLTIAKVFKLSSLAALIAFAALPVISFGFAQPLPVTLIFTVLSLILIYRHRSNIQRLIKGQES